jgi:hypothetical protein
MSKVYMEFANAFFSICMPHCVDMCLLKITILPAAHEIRETNRPAWRELALRVMISAYF